MLIGSVSAGQRASYGTLLVFLDADGGTLADLLGLSPRKSFPIVAIRESNNATQR